MSFYRVLGKSSSPSESELVKLLVAEMNRGETPNEDPPKEPIIIAEPAVGEIKRLLIVWELWKDLSLEDRGGVIMDAWVQVVGVDKAQHVGVAMGLTEEEAKKLAGAGLPELSRYLKAA
jgi:hypothetical protein